MKVFLELLAFIIFLVGAILIFKLDLKDFLRGLSAIFLWKPKRKLKARVLEATGRKKTNWF